MENYFGVDYYPEHWPADRWKTDAALMQEMGIDVVRMGEFSWHKMEPVPGEYHFEWLDDVISLLAEYGMKTVLGTPTAAPPAWLIEKEPEILPVDQYGIRRNFGGRHHDCQSNEIYRAYIKKLVTAMAEHFKDNPDVIGWQIDNELGNSHEDLCMCDSCARHYQKWLQRRYQNIDCLNHAWGNSFWSQEYDRFSQICPPKITVTGRNPSAMLDWRRFCSDLIVDFLEFQAEIIRKICPHQFITHNFMGFSDKVNYFDLAEKLDFVSHDQYPSQSFGDGVCKDLPRALATSSAGLELMRGVKRKNFWIMEQQAGAPGWECMGSAAEPGRLSMWTLHSIAHGADTVVYFRWRVSPFGTEQYWHGILPHSGIPGRTYRELKDTIHKYKPLMKEIQGTGQNAEVGIIYSYDQEYAFKIQPQNPDLNYNHQLIRYYEGFQKRNIPVDFIGTNEKFEDYRLLIAPLQYLMNTELEEKYRAYVKNGGALVLTMRTGVKTESNLCMTDKPLPGSLSDILGIVVEEYDCIREGCLSVKWGELCLTGEKWCDVIRMEGARKLAEADSGFYRGNAVVTRNRYGKGLAYYVGTEPGDMLMERLVQELSESNSIKGLLETPAGVEAVRRCGEDKDYVFVLNHNRETCTIEIPHDWKCYAGEKNGNLEGYETRIYTVNK